MLTVKRQSKLTPFSYAFVLDKVTESSFFESSYANNSIFPLYLYSGDDKTVNFTKKFSDFIRKQYGTAYNAENIFNYIYAILHSLTYRSKYAELFKINFPRIPFTDDAKLFEKLSKLGRELIDAHLLKNKGKIEINKGNFIGKGLNNVEKIIYKHEKNIGKIYINKTQYYDDVPRNVWEFKIGGTCGVIENFLDERKNRRLSSSEIELVEIIINVIFLTIEQMKKIDNITKDWI
jgi:predicted helicase